MLPSKTAPKTQRTKSGPLKKKSRKATVEEVEDEDSPRNISARNHASAEPTSNGAKTSANMEGNGKKVIVLSDSSNPVLTQTYHLEVKSSKKEPGISFL
jgi:hypothetical protein